MSAEWKFAAFAVAVGAALLLFALLFDGSVREFLMPRGVVD